jgi:hypothetical protein
MTVTRTNDCHKNKLISREQSQYILLFFNDTVDDDARHGLSYGRDIEHKHTNRTYIRTEEHTKELYTFTTKGKYKDNTYNDTVDVVNIVTSIARSRVVAVDFDLKYLCQEE